MVCGRRWVPPILPRVCALRAPFVTSFKIYNHMNALQLGPDSIRMLDLLLSTERRVLGDSCYTYGQNLKRTTQCHVIDHKSIIITSSL